MLSNEVLLRFANKCERFDPYFIKATENGICFYASKKYYNLIIASFSDLNCSISALGSFYQNNYYYVIQ